jgi:hypothetical protein
MTQRASWPIYCPDQERVVWLQLIESLTKRSTLIERTTGCVDEDAVTTGRHQSVVLQVRVLVGSGHTRVPRQSAASAGACRIINVPHEAF